MFYPTVFRFLRDLVHWYTPPGDRRNVIYDSSSNGAVQVYFSPDCVLIHRYEPSPPLLCDVGEDGLSVPGQPESRIIIKIFCCGGKPYLSIRYDYKHNGWWLCKSNDLLSVIPGELTYSTNGVLTKSGGIKPCAVNPSPPSQSVWFIPDWEDLFTELMECSESFYGDPSDFIDSLNGVSGPLVGCLHPIQSACSFNGYQISIIQDFIPLTPWIPIKLPTQYETIIEAFSEHIVFILGVLGLSDDLAVIRTYVISDPLTLVVTLQYSENEEFCTEDSYWNALQLGLRFCPCPFGYIYDEGDCRLPCPQGFHWNSTTQKCETCPPCSVWNGEICVPISDCLDDQPNPDPDHYFDDEDNEIKPDPTPTPPDDGNDYWWDGDEWVPDDPSANCPSGYYWNGSECVPDPPPKCPEGTYWNGSSCVPKPTPVCPEGYTWDGAKCWPPCPPGYYRVGNNCVPDPPVCPPGCYFDGEGCNCDPPPPENPPNLPEDGDDGPIPFPHVGPPKPTQPLPDLPSNPPPPAFCVKGEYYTISNTNPPLPGRVAWEGSNIAYECLYPPGSYPHTSLGNQTFVINGVRTSYAVYQLNGVLRNKSTGTIIGGGKLYNGGPWTGPLRVLDYPAPGPYYPCSVVQDGVWYIRVFYKVNISSFTCIPFDPVLGWLIDKFLDAFDVTGGYGNTYFGQHYTVFPGKSNDPPPYLDTTMQAPLWTLRFKMALYAFDPYEIVPWVPCFEWTATPIHVQTKFYAY